MRKYLVGLLVVIGLMGFSVALDLDKVSVGGGYTVSYVDSSNGYQSVPNGWGAEIGYDLTKPVTVFGEVGVGYRHGVMVTAMGGVRYMLSELVELPPDWLSYYVQVFGGVAHKAGQDPGTGLAVGVGGGMLIRLDKHWHFKFAQVDYIHQFGEVSANKVRVSCGVQYHF